LIAKKDRELRETYDERLGDYEDVGFRLCEGADEVELRKCFRKGDYDILVIGYNEKGSSFGCTTTIEAFASEFKGPVVLVGPASADSFYLNRAAVDRMSDLLLDKKQWHVLEGKHGK
jgi:hypothetical protein